MLKEARKNEYFAKLQNVPTSARKMRLVVDLVRGQEAYKALGIPKFTQKEAARRWSSCCAAPYPTMSRKQSRKPNQASSTYAQSTLTKQACSNASVPLPRAAATASANAPTT